MDDPGASALQEGDFGLDGDLRATMLQALETHFQENDADEADGTDQPPATPSPDAATPAPGEDGAGGGGDAGEGAAPDDLAPAAPGAAPTVPGTPEDAMQFSLDAYAQEYFGTKLTPAQARELFSVLGGLQSLTPAQREQVDRIVAGGAPDQYPVTQGQPVAPITQPPATPPSATSPTSPLGQPFSLPPRPDDEYEAQLYDKYIAPLAAATTTQLSQIQAEIDRNTQAQLAREQQEIMAAVESSANAWRAEHPVLTQGEFDALTDKVARSQVFPAMVRTHGSPAEATRAVLDQFFWADPNLRSKALANVASGRAAGDPHTIDPDSPVAQQNAALEANRQARAASVAGGGGAATPRGAVPQPKDAAGRKQAMIQELAQQGDFS
jgi:hypothetical protein